MKNTLIDLYNQMSLHTEPECAKCRVPHSCCSAEYCDMAEAWARDIWKIDTKPLRTDHPHLPYMGTSGGVSTGCILPPHLRPACTLHTCDINGFGFKPKDPTWTMHYFFLREKIDQVEYTLSIEKLDEILQTLKEKK